MTLACADCHTGLGSGTANHRTPANPVVFSGGPLLVAGGGTAPAYTVNNGQCANVYCHGAKMPGGDNTGTNRTPTWGTTTPLPAIISATACGTCHGFPPSAASGHPAVTVLAGFPATAIGTTCRCHPNLSATGNSYANIFVNKALHINGTFETPSGGGGHAFPNPGSAHRSASNGTGCIGCHVMGDATSTYPVAAGTAPTCRACHLTANPTTDPHCSDCHGLLANDTNALLAWRPTGGSAFPNRPGEHNRSQHIGRACTVCHPFTSGDSRHGWSNRLKSSAAQVGGAGTSINS